MRVSAMETGVLALRVNGREAATVSAVDRGLSYGDGVFETLTVQRGQPVAWQPHRERLRHGCRHLGIAGVDLSLIDDEVATVCQGVDRAVLKVIVTRGEGGRGYGPPQRSDQRPTHIVQLHTHPDYPEHFSRTGVLVRWCDLRLGIQPALAGLKHLNRLENVLARAEWHDPRIGEGLLCDVDDRVVCGTMSNLFLVRGNTLITPGLTRCGVAGITRAAIINAAHENHVPVTVCDVSRDDVLQADELFVCNSVMGVWPVQELDGQPFSVGPVTRKVAEWLASWKNEV